MPQIHEIYDREGYLSRMAGSQVDKVRPALFWPSYTRSILDVGCANGVVTLEFAKMFPEAHVVGIDLDGDFVNQARLLAKNQNVTNIRFEQAYIRDILDSGEKFDVVHSGSMNHEVGYYNRGRVSIVEATAHIVEMLNPQGRHSVRDMILPESTKTATLMCPSVIEKIRAASFVTLQLQDYEKRYGMLNTQESVNHFLLKYMYTDNWDKELKEYYLPFSAEQYNSLFRLVDMTVEHQEYYLLDYLKGKWIESFNLTEAEVSVFRSTGLIVASKNEPNPLHQQIC